MKTLDVNSQKILANYEKTMKDFMKKHDIDSDVWADIQSSIYEKIEELETISPKKISHILKEMGTPQEIFSENLSENSETSDRTKPSEQFFKDGDETIRKTVQNLPTQAKNIFASIWNVLMGFVHFCWNNFWWIIQRFCFALCACIFVVMLFVLILLGGAYLGNFHIQNVYPFFDLPITFPVGLVLGLVSCTLLSFYFVYRLFASQKVKHHSLLIVGVTLLVPSFICAIGVLVNMWNKIQFTPVDTTEYTISVPASITEQNIDKQIPFNIKNVGDRFGFLQLWSMSFYGNNQYEVSPDEKIHIFINERVIGNQKLLATLPKIAEPIFTFDEDTYTIQYALKYGDAKYPLTLVQSWVVKIQLPKNLLVKTQGFATFNQQVFNEMHYCEEFYFNDDGNVICYKKPQITMKWDIQNMMMKIITVKWPSKNKNIIQKV